MSAKTEKKDRKMRRIMIQNEIESNKTMVLEVVIENLQESKLSIRLAFCITILFKKVVKK